jgi:CheY-like chemotaxis protein
MQLRLEYNGYDTCFAADAASAVAVASTEQPDLIILDLGLPTDDGFLLIERLKAHPALAAIPIIVVSARDARANRERAIKGGAEAYLQKPVDNAELLAVIRKALGVSCMHDFGEQAALAGRLAAIRETFLRRTRGELPVLLELLARIQAGDSTGLVPLKTYAHRINGSGATLAFAAISRSAGSLENLLEALIGTPEAGAVEPHHLRCLVEWGQRLALDIGAATTQSPHA